jgi:hypothetical protein
VGGVSSDPAFLGPKAIHQLANPHDNVHSQAIKISEEKSRGNSPGKPNSSLEEQEVVQQPFSNRPTTSKSNPNLTNL